MIHDNIEWKVLEAIDAGHPCQFISNYYGGKPGVAIVLAVKDDIAIGSVLTAECAKALANTLRKTADQIDAISTEPTSEAPN